MQSDIVIVAYIDKKSKSRVARMMIRLRRNDGEFPLCENFPKLFTFHFSLYNKNDRQSGHFY